MAKYKLNWFDKEGEELFIGLGKIPLCDYLQYLSTKRKFNEQLVIDYTIKNYELDLTGIIDDYFLWETKIDLYSKYETENQRKPPVQDDRDYFNKYGRRYYENFIKSYGFYADEDCLIHVFRKSVVHHIHPLIYEGSNDIRNLIHLSRFSHDILHNNPLEKMEKYCYQALDYLGYLYNPNGMSNIIKKYNLKQYDDNAIGKMFKACVEVEMNIYYDKLRLSVA